MPTSIDWSHCPPSSAALDQIANAIEHGAVRRAFPRLIGELDLRRRSLDPAAWRGFARGTFRQHALMASLRQDPFTRHAFDKPRGYAGDAELIDYIYGYGDGIVLPPCTARGRALYAAAMEKVPCRAVRARKTYLAGVLEQLGRRQPGARVVSIASGHMREVGASTACRAGAFQELVAFDQDERSLAVVARDYVGIDAVRTVAGRVRALLTGRLPLEGFDLAYSTGLFDYLNRRTARALTRRMFAMLRPGGELVIANFSAGVSGVGYMEACMDWHLVYRREADMLDLCGDLDAKAVAHARVETDPATGGILFLRVRRAEAQP
ncbi:MAG: class I SAM-dependent methyltransferase [Planctomycetota bacterium]